MTAASFTINHAAPECLAGAPPSASADLYELSSTLYTLLAGHPPFVAGASAALVALVSMVMNDPAPPLQRPDVPPSLNGLLLAGLAKGPVGRPPDATAFGRALQAVQGELGLPVTAWPTAPSSVAGAPAGLAGGIGTMPLAGPGTIPSAASALPPAPASATAPPAPATGPGAPVLIPETIAPFAPSDPTRFGIAGATPASMTMVAAGGPRPPVGGPSNAPGPAAHGPKRPGRGRVIAVVAAVVVLLALVAGGTWWVLVGRGTSGQATAYSTLTTTSDEVATESSDGDPSTDVTGTPTSESTSSEALLPGLTTDVGLTTDIEMTTATAAPPPLTPATTAASTTRTPPPTTVVKTVVVTTRTTAKPTTKPTTAAPTGLTIDSFGVLSQNISGGKVDCSAQPSHNDAPDSGVPILQFTWSAPKATTAWIGVDAGPDASVAPFESDLPPVVNNGSFVEVPFACSVPQHTYTLTVAGPGTKTSKTITLQRGALPAPQPTGTP